MLCSGKLVHEKELREARSMERPLENINEGSTRSKNKKERKWSWIYFLFSSFFMLIFHFVALDFSAFVGCVETLSSLKNHAATHF